MTFDPQKLADEIRPLLATDFIIETKPNTLCVRRHPSWLESACIQIQLTHKKGTNHTYALAYAVSDILVDRPEIVSSSITHLSTMPTVKTIVRDIKWHFDHFPINSINSTTGILYCLSVIQRVKQEHIEYAIGTIVQKLFDGVLLDPFREMFFRQVDNVMQCRGWPKDQAYNQCHTLLENIITAKRIV